MYTERELVRIARRENNSRRNYLVVNPLQGKHIPVSPGKALGVFSELAGLLRKYSGERLLADVTVQTAPLAKSKLRSVQFCETCGRQNAFFSRFVCILVTVQRPV